MNKLWKKARPRNFHQLGKRVTFLVHSPGLHNRKVCSLFLTDHLLRPEKSIPLLHIRMGSWFSSEGEEAEINMDVKNFVDQKIAGKKVVMFSKSTCPFCSRAKKILEKYNLSKEDYEVIEINNEDNCSGIQDYLNKLTGGRTVPRIFINQKFVGGCDDLTALDKKGDLKALLS